AVLLNRNRSAGGGAHAAQIRGESRKFLSQFAHTLGLHADHVGCVVDGAQAALPVCDAKIRGRRGQSLTGELDALRSSGYNVSHLAPFYWRSLFRVSVTRI